METSRIYFKYNYTNGLSTSCCKLAKIVQFEFLALSYNLYLK
jgi:hypothetical protein